MNASKTLTRVFLTFSAATILLFTASIASAQTDSTPKKRLKSPEAVKGFVGGEAHDSYVIHARKNQTLKVQFSWLGKDDNAQRRFLFLSSLNPRFKEQVRFVQLTTYLFTVSEN